VSLFRLTIAPVPEWVDGPRLLGVDAPLESIPLAVGRRLEVALPAPMAADVAARLRGLGLDGQPLDVQAVPPLSRALVRAARLRDARLRREATPGFTQPGARASGEGRYSLTPESLALALGRLACGARVVDACCGSGGNAIGFARAGCEVVAIERAPERIAEARHNAAVFGVSSRILFVAGDACVEVPTRAADVLFIDPPWGEDYDKRRTTRSSFPLLDALLGLPLGRYGELWVKVPSGFEVASVAGARASAWFGAAAGDAHRIKFVLLRATPP
jgi:SAM-dependent methyltransferase